MLVHYNQITGYKELVISFKVIYLNIFNIIIVDISHDNELRIIYRHESSQLWESESFGLYLRKNESFMKFNKNGAFVVNIAGEKLSFIDWEGMPK